MLEQIIIQSVFIILIQNIETYYLIKLLNIKNILYNKIKDSFVIKVSTQKGKFSIIDDIYKQFENYNRKYATSINIHQIIQLVEEDMNIINIISCIYNFKLMLMI